MKELKDYTDEELRNELKRRANERRKDTPREIVYVEFEATIKKVDNIYYTNFYISKCIFFFMKQQREFITFRKTVNNTESAIHQLLDRIDHHIPETHIKGCFEITHLFGQPRKTSSIQASHQIQIRKDALVKGLLVDPHFLI